MPATQKRTRPAVVIAGILICAGFIVFRAQYRAAVRSTATVVPLPSPKQRGISDRVEEYGEIVRRRLEPDFIRAGIPYPPSALVFVGLKQEKRLEVYASGKDGRGRLIRSYPILAASGHAGPKFREGDLQVPEGLYRIESLNPNSLFHLSLRVNYPNAFDRDRAADEHRENLGGDIMIHGNACSTGCLAMGDPAAEDLFVLAALTGIKHIQVVLSPVDFRVRDVPLTSDDPNWLPGLYEQIKGELQKYPVADRSVE